MLGGATSQREKLYLDITNILFVFFPQIRYIEVFDITNHRYKGQFSPVPWHFVKSWFYFIRLFSQFVVILVFPSAVSFFVSLRKRLDIHNNDNKNNNDDDDDDDDDDDHNSNKLYLTRVDE